MTDRRAALEAEVRQACARGQASAAAALVVRDLGDEIGRYLVALVRVGGAELDEVFSMWCEDLLRGLPGFTFSSSLRTWAYTLARHAAARRARGELRQRRRIVLPGELDEPAAAVRTRTVQYLRTAVKDRLAEIRAQLTDDERELLALRVDRQLPWRDIAEIIGAEHGGDDDALRRLEQALRKRFETLTRRLRRLMAEQAP